ncbi:condensation domain-containing protein [Streptomyces sp. NE06-03E]|uniref:condensation domain-containing protein n=1 Tax=Streptomyces sp. NE06-03E TaxID=3028695 RepID=UPI0039F5A61F
MTDAPHDRTRPDTLRLTAAQRGLWFAQRLDPANPSYNVAEYADIRGRMEPGLLRRAVGHTAAETEALRSTFGERDGAPFQRVRGHLGSASPCRAIHGSPGRTAGAIAPHSPGGTSRPAGTGLRRGPAGLVLRERRAGGSAVLPP